MIEPENELRLEYCGAKITVSKNKPFVLGREADLVIDKNPYLHRRFIELSCLDDIWWIANIGSQISATVSDPKGRLQAWLAPQAAMPVLYSPTILRFSAGSTTYELTLETTRSPITEHLRPSNDDGDQTVGALRLNTEQHLLVIALAEPLLRLDHVSHAVLPTSKDAAKRLGWELTKFNRKLDHLCQKLTTSGVQGLHGAPGDLAANRRARLVEYALAVRLVVPTDVQLLQ